jgi:hypothetical protein
MARVKVTTANIKAKLIDWWQSATNRADELIFIGNEIDRSEWQNQAWQLGNMIIDFQPDATSGFTKITFKEKL